MRTCARGSLLLAIGTSLVLVQILACGSEPASVPSASKPSNITLDAGVSAEPVEKSPVVPMPGEVMVETSSAGTATLFATQAPRLAILRRLGNSAGFRVVIGQIEDPQRLTIRATELPIEQVIAQILEDVSYELRYEVSDSDGTNALTTVTVGDFKTQQRRMARERRARFKERREERIAQRRDESTRGTSDDRSPRPPISNRDREEADAELIRRLEDPDPSVRIEALQDAPIEGVMANRVISLLAEDPSPEVRSAAAERLAMSDAGAALGGLLSALGDPDPAVVLAAIDALEFAGDESIAPQLEKLGAHPNPAVRVAAVEAAEFLR